jgi:DNA-binding response OmpR family regulator
MSTGTRVLVVEDNDDARTVIQLALETEGFEVAVAENGRHALAALRACGARIVITDILMPEQDGVETIAQLRAEFPEVAIIAMSGAYSAAGFDYLAVPRELGAHILRKPFDMQELVSLVRKLL